MDMGTGNLCGCMPSTIIDLTMSMAGAKAHGAVTTAKLEVDFKRPVLTPCVVICKVNVSEIEGRRCVMDGTMEDGKGEVHASATSVFVRPPGEEGRKVAEWLMSIVSRQREGKGPRM